MQKGRRRKQRALSLSLNSSLHREVSLDADREVEQCKAAERERRRDEGRRGEGMREEGRRGGRGGLTLGGGHESRAAARTGHVHVAAHVQEVLRDVDVPLTHTHRETLNTDIEHRH